MSSTVRTLSDRWHRVSQRRVGLRPDIAVRRQRFRDEIWYVLYDPDSGSFARIRPEAWAFLRRLTPDQTVDEVWQQAMTRDAETAPGQEEAVQLLTRLESLDFLSDQEGSDVDELFDRHARRRRRETQSKLLGFLFLRIPLWNPDRWLAHLTRGLTGLGGWLALLIWTGVVALGGWAALGHWRALADQAQGALAPDNLGLLTLSFLAVKLLHELGHGIVCRRFGAEVPAMGVMLLVFAPLPYVEVTPSWRLRNRWHRALIGAAGMLTEFFLAALALMIWLNAEEGPIKALAYNVVLICTVSTLVFNANPLLKLDGYYILADLLEMPNLYARSRQFLLWLLERYVLGNRHADAPAHTRGEPPWLILYGLASSAYRLLVMVGITLFVASQWLLAGVLMGAFLFLVSLVLPLLKGLAFLLLSRRLATVRGRALLAASTFAGLIGLGLFALPLPDHLDAQGVVESTRTAQVSAGTAGHLLRLVATPGTRVVTGAPLAILENPDLTTDLAAAEARLQQLTALQDKASFTVQRSDLPAISRQQSVIRQRIAQIRAEQAALTVTAPQDGLWSAPTLRGDKGRWVERGAALGLIVDPDRLSFAAVVPQARAAMLFEATPQAGEVKLLSAAAIGLPARGLTIIPFQHQRLPSTALGWVAGGDIAIRSDDPGGQMAQTPFFLVRVRLDTDAVAMPVRHGMLGWLRLTYAPRPLGPRLLDAIARFFQGRFRV